MSASKKSVAVKDSTSTLAGVAESSQAPPKRKRRQNPETKIRKEIQDYLRERGWFVFPNTQGLGCYRGISDLTAMKDGRIVWIEIKTPKGKQSYEQWEFEQKVAQYGKCEYLIARCVEDLKRIEVTPHASDACLSQ